QTCALPISALIWTSIGSTVSSTKELKGHWKQVWFYTIFTVVGSILGCILLLSFPPKIFEKAVPFFIAFSGLMIIVSGKHHSLNTKAQPTWLKIIRSEEHTSELQSRFDLVC